MAYEDYHVNADDVKLDGDPNIRRTVPPSPSGGGGGIAYGTCTTAAATAAKVVTLSDATGWELKQGATICIKFTNTNTAQNPTLNVNNSGAKSIYYNRALITTGGLWVAGENDRYTTFMYDGTYWVWIGSSIDRNTTYSNMSTSELTTGTATTSRVVRADYLKKGIEEIIKAPITDIVNVYGAKNLLPVDYPSNTKNGITFTVNADGSITANGTATAQAAFQIVNKSNYPSENWESLKNIISGKAIILNGCPSGGSASTYLMRKWGQSSSGTYTDYGDGVEFTPTESSLTDYNWDIEIVIFSGQTVNNLTFYPMLRLASIQDDTYVPYVPTNRQLLSHKDNGILGAKNLIPYDYLTSEQVVNGVTITPLGDGTYKFNGTATAFADIRLSPAFSYNECIKLPKGVYALNGTPTSGYSGNYGTSSPAVGIIYNDGTNRNNLGFTRDTDFLFVQSNESARYEIKITFWETTVFNNAIFKPMIRLASDSDNTYQPYAKTNKELTDAFTNQVSDSDDAYSSSKSYAVDDLCIYNNVLYKCITACSAAAWSVNQNCFEATTLTDEVSTLKDALTDAEIWDGNRSAVITTNNGTWTATDNGELVIIGKNGGSSSNYVYLYDLNYTAGTPILTISQPSNDGGFVYVNTTIAIKGHTYKMMFAGFINVSCDFIKK